MRKTPRFTATRAKFLTALALPILAVLPLRAAELTIHVDKPGVSVSPTLYGMFFEDINRAGDGGLYAEMIQNRSFEDSRVPLAWTPLNATTNISLDTTEPLNANNPTSLRIQINKGSNERSGVYNQGFKGIPSGKAPDTSPQWLGKFEAAQRNPANGLVVEAGKVYLLSLYARQQDFSGALTVSLETQKGVVLAMQSIAGVGAGWKKFEVVLTATQSEPDARLVVSVDQTGTLWLDMVSLFPKDTYKGRPNGLRPDLAKMMADMHPGLLRFPGGSFSEGAVLADAWRWKETLGDVAARKGNWNIWGYRSTNGLGFHEYLQLAEDLGAAPLFVAHVGMAEKDFVPMDELEPWIQDLLDAIEYANGAVSSKWGAVRAKNGHPAPFNLKYVEIGNENGMGYHWGGGNRADYLPRYKAFYERIKAKYPEIVTIANIHTEPDVPAEIVDEHYYESSEWFFKAATLYDTYDRTKPKLYLGEYAAKKDGGRGNLIAALGEAAFLTGLERNADVVAMSSYAPLFTHPVWEKWRPDAIVFDNTRAYATPSYHVQAMFAANRPDVVLPVDLPTFAGPAPGLFAVAGLTKQTRELILKVVNASPRPEPLDIRFAGLKAKLADGTCVELSGASPTDEN
ncbi:MAG: alpha-L-arabinofuranosidase C-terminal domain-containing protein, partial [Luteolibacter sp.]